MVCDIKEESEKKIRRKRGRVCFFSGHISLCCPQDLNAWNRLDEDINLEGHRFISYLNCLY